MMIRAKPSGRKKETVSFKKARKEDALALAEIIYNIYKEEKISGKIQNGQNNAQTKEK